MALVEAGWELPPEVLLVDAGTPGLDLVTFLSGRRAVVLVDSVSARAAPGTIVLYEKHEILRAPSGIRQGVHEPALRDTLQALELAREGPADVVLVGVVPENVQTRAGLSAPVQAAMARAAEEVVKQLERFGVRLARRQRAMTPAIWWEQPDGAAEVA